MKIIQTTGLLLAAVLLLSGCMGSQPKGPIYTLPKLKQKEEVVSIQAQARISSNGACITTKGERILSEKGDAIKAYTLDGKGYYVLAIVNGDYILQDENEKIIKTFSNASSVKFFESGIGEPIIAVKLSNNSTNYYDNIYKFDGKKVRLINKNVLIDSYNNEILGQYIVSAYFNQYNEFTGYTIKDITTGKNVNIKVSKPYIMFGVLLSRYKLLGVAGNNFVYVYNDENSDSVIEVYNTKTKIKTVIARNWGLYQLLKYGNLKVLKVFANKKLSEESEMHNHNKNLKSKYTNEDAKYIDLNTLEEVKYSNEELLKAIPLFTSFSNMGGGSTSETYITYRLNRLEQMKGTEYYLK